MATPASRLVQDQNLNIHSGGGAPLGGKVDLSKAAKKGGGLDGRKALNDISNSGKPSALQASKKHNSINLIPVAKDVVGGSKIAFTVGGKANLTKAPEKGKGHSRKALSDLTNSVNPSLQPPHKNSIKEEGFLHNHQECIKAQRKIVNYGYFLETVGLGSPFVLPRPLKLKPESPVMKILEMEDEEGMPWALSDRNKKAQFPDCFSPLVGSPNNKSVKSAYEFWKDEENLADFKLIESPQKKQ